MSDNRARPRRPLVALAVIAAIALAVPIGANAGLVPTFPDVPGTHPFHDEIEWMADTEITTGFDDGTFKPNQAVTRQSMSAFMQRLYDVQDDLAWQTGSEITSTTSAAFVDVPGSQVRLDVPPGIHATVFARFSAESRCSGTSGWCSVRIVMSENDGPFEEMRPAVGINRGFDSVSVDGDDGWESHAIEQVEFAEPGGTYRLKVQYAVSGAGVTSFQLDDWTFIAQTDLQPSDYLPL